jgi:hypothetical protein
VRARRELRGDGSGAAHNAHLELDAGHGHLAPVAEVDGHAAAVLETQLNAEAAHKRLEHGEVRDARAVGARPLRLGLFLSAAAAAAAAVAAAIAAAAQACLLYTSPSPRD